MKIIPTLWLIILFFGLLPFTLFADHGCSYVNALNGLFLREGPSLDAAVIMKLPFGTQVDGVPGGESDTIIDNGVKIIGEWTQVSLSVPFRSESVYGYVFDAFLSEHLDEIPPSALYLYTELAIGKIKNGVWQNSLFIDWHDDISKFNVPSAYTDCYPRYQQNFSFPTINNQVVSSKNNSVLDTLHHYLQLELVGQECFKLIPTQYAIDTTWQPSKFPIDNNLNLKGFYLPINNGQDSVLVKDEEGEFLVTMEYVGEIKALNKYVIAEEFEGIEWYTIDKQTGKKESLSIGLTSYSPNGIYQVDYLRNDVTGLSGDVTISRLDDKLKPTFTVRVSFKSWVPDQAINQIIWLSENEFLLKVSPVDNFVSRNYADIIPENHFQYLKCTISNFESK